MASIAGRVVAGAIFKRVWRVTRNEDDPPKPKESEYSWREVLIAATIQGHLRRRQGRHRPDARAFERWTAEWPGD